MKGRFGDCYQFFPHKAAILCTRVKQVALGDICGSNVSGLVTLNKALNVSVTEWVAATRLRCPEITCETCASG